MYEITHMIDKDGDVVVNATWENHSYGAQLEPRYQVEYNTLKVVQLLQTDSTGLKNSKKNNLISSQRSKYNEVPIVTEDDMMGQVIHISI